MADVSALGPGTAALLGAVQGLTEFLPVSSSGHLALTSHWLQTRRGLQMPEDILFECLVHVATLLAVVVHYRRDVGALLRFWLSTLWRSDTRFTDPAWGLSLALALGTVATAVVGFALEPWARAAFDLPQVVGGFLLVTAGVLAVTLWSRAPAQGATPITLLQAVIIGVVQGLATFPGISRSGTTIAVALMLGVARPEAARFSFLLAIPAILGATLLEFRDLESLTIGAGAMVTGFVTAAVVGYLALITLIGFVNRGRLAWFAPYCVAVGLAAILFV